MGADSRRETYEFLFDKRLQLFNIRREHEWKIFFGVMTLIGAVDAALVTKTIHLSWTAYACWVFILIVLLFTSINLWC